MISDGVSWDATDPSVVEVRQMTVFCPLPEAEHGSKADPGIPCDRWYVDEDDELGFGASGNVWGGT